MNERLLNLFREELLADNVPLGENLGNGFRVLHGYLDVTDEGVFRRRPVALMEIFTLLAQHKDLIGVRASTIRLIVDHLYLIDETFRGDPRVMAQFMELLRQPQGVYTQLQRMNRYGVLAAFIPAFEQIVGRMQFDLFHVYTVDQHILFVVRNLRRFAYGKYEEQYPHAAKVFRQVQRPEVLYLAALFHDIAKGRGGDHSDLGAVDAQEFCARLPMRDSDRELVAWLVEHHLLMSQTAQKKDISDPETIRRFAEVVAGRERLDYLYLLTVADISATSPRLWNHWKSGLLWELHQGAHGLLKQDPGQPVDRESAAAQTREEALLRLVEFGANPAQVEQVWQTLPESVFLRFSAGQLAWGTQELLQHPEGIRITVRRREDRGISEVLVVAPDYTGLFATITTVFDEIGLDVLSARVVTTSDARSFDLFQVMDRQGRPLNEVDVQALVERLHQPLGRQQVREPLVRPMPRRLRPFLSPPVLSYRKARLSEVTEMEVECTDRPGLLSQLAAAMVGCGVRIHDAMIATFGDRVEDVFLVTDRADRPLQAELQEQLSAAIAERLQR
jgi:[protein-PII] uridylyltransferase